MKLVCVSRYRNSARNLDIAIGDVITDPVLIGFLLRDAPGCFADEALISEVPPADKMIKRPVRK